MSKESTIFRDLNILEEDSKQLESIAKLQQAFREVRQNYRDEYTSSMNHVLGQIKEKMRKNHGMVDAVNSYILQYVEPSKHKKATDELYNLLAAEMLHTLQALQHTTCLCM